MCYVHAGAVSFFVLFCKQFSLDISQLPDTSMGSFSLESSRIFFALSCMNVDILLNVSSETLYFGCLMK